MEQPPAKRRRISSPVFDENIKNDHQQSKITVNKSVDFDTLDPMVKDQVIVTLKALDLEPPSFHLFKTLQNNDQLDWNSIDLKKLLPQYQLMKRQQPPTLDHISDKLIQSMNESILNGNINDFTMKKDNKKRYLACIFSFLSGSDIVSFDIAFGKTWQIRAFIDKIAQTIYESNAKYQNARPLQLDLNPYSGLPTNSDQNLVLFPAQRPVHEFSYKFLYQLHLCTPSVFLLGGTQYSKSTTKKLDQEGTKWFLHNHRKYTIEKALSGGGLAMIENVFQRLNLKNLKQQWDDQKQLQLLNKIHFFNTLTPNFSDDLSSLAINYPRKVKKLMVSRTISYLSEIEDLTTVVDFSKLMQKYRI